MEIEENECKLGFLFCGEIAYSFIASIVKRRILARRHIWVADTQQNLPIFDDFKDMINILPSLRSSEVASNSEIIFLGPEMHSIKEYLDVAILPALPNHPFKNKLIISFIRDLTCAELGERLLEHGIDRQNVKVMRAITNITMSTDEGLTYYCRNQFFSKEYAKPIVELFSNHGMVSEVSESLMDVAAYGITVCGPAYVYLMIEAMADGAVKNNLPRELAINFVAQVFVGAAKMVLSTGIHPGNLKNKLCVPGGPTIHGIYELEAGNVRASIIKSVDAAAKILKKPQMPSIRESSFF